MCTKNFGCVESCGYVAPSVKDLGNDSRHERIGKYFNKQVLFLKTVRKKITYLGNCK